MLLLNRSSLAKALTCIVLACLMQSVATPSAYSAAREVTITLGADDNISGVAWMQIAENKDNPPPAIPFNLSTVISTEASIIWVRVQDRALNWSTWVEVQVGGAPVTRDPLAKTVYVPVAIVPYVPTPSTPTPSTPTPPSVTPPSVTPPPAISSAPTNDSPPPALTPQADTETVKVITELITTDTPTVGVPVPESPLVVTSPVKEEILIPKTPPAVPAGVKEIPAQTKPAVSVSVSSAPKSEVKVGVNKVLELKMPSTSGATSVKASVTDATGKKLNLDVKVDKKTGKITMPKLSFSKKGTYIISTIIGKKTIKVSVTVR
jgi:hypothetical protein